MIVAIEGPDCAGKTTLLSQLHWPSAAFVPRRRCTVEELAAAQYTNRAIDHLWRLLHDPDRLYICDRFHAVSDPVYAPIYGRRCDDFSYWYTRVKVVLLMPPLELLRRRHADRGDPHFDAMQYERCIYGYAEHVKNFEHAVFADPSPEDVRCVISSWWVRECTARRLQGLRLTPDVHAPL